MKSIALAGTALAVALATAPAAHAIAVSIPATSNIYLAGGNTYTSNSCSLIPQNNCIGFAPVEVALGSGAISLTLTNVSGTVAYSDTNVVNADGIAIFGTPYGGGGNNVAAAGTISGYTFTAGQFALVGVFLGASLPGVAPANFDNSLPLSDSFSPSVGQVFFIGDGLGTNGTQTFFVPVGATRLFLGFVDQYFAVHNDCGGHPCNAGLYGDNTVPGHLALNGDVNIAAAVPEPSAILLFATGLAGIAFRRFRRA